MIPYLSGAARVAAVIGDPVAHSRSPRLHGYWLRRYAVDGAYVPLRVAPVSLSTAIQGLLASGFAGVNVTIPHKREVLSLATNVTLRARRIGAANLLTFRADGCVTADNTDSIGFAAHLSQCYPDWKKRVSRALVLGAGGAARAVVVALQDAGVQTIEVCNRSLDRTMDLADSLTVNGDYGTAQGDEAPVGRIEVIEWDRRHQAVATSDLVVNTTALGMAGQPALDLQIDPIRPETIVYDIVYQPLETPLLKSARDHGCQVVDGLGMLIHQARPSFECFFGILPEMDDDVRALMLR